VRAVRGLHGLQRECARAQDDHILPHACDNFQHQLGKPAGIQSTCHTRRLPMLWCMHVM
jgi:hypothetical protein